MGRILVVSKVENLEQHKELEQEYHIAFEINDFFQPSVFEDEKSVDQIIARYKECRIPEDSTLHGAFLDLVVFSSDSQIREISYQRMEQSMEIGKQLGVKGVIFHTNGNPFLDSMEYEKEVVEGTVSALKKLMTSFPDTEIYLENMFDRSPDLLVRIGRALQSYPTFGVCYDYAHASIYGEEANTWAPCLSGFVKHIHINDNDLKHDLHLAIGTGQIDWKQFELEYRTYFEGCSLLIETTLPESQRKSLEYLKKNTNLLSESFGGDLYAKK